MKKITMSALLVGLVVLASCNKDDAAAAGSSSVAGTATIKGVAKAERNGNVAGLEPKGSATVLAIYNMEDLVLNPVPGTIYPDVTLSTTTATDGSYSFSIPTNGKPVSVKIKPQDFIENQLGAAPLGTAQPITENVFFSAGAINLNISEKESLIRNIDFL
jgi:hypothetical protein